MHQTDHQICTANHWLFKQQLGDSELITNKRRMEEEWKRRGEERPFHQTVIIAAIHSCLFVVTRTQRGHAPPQYGVMAGSVGGKRPHGMSRQP